MTEDAMPKVEYVNPAQFSRICQRRAERAMRESIRPTLPRQKYLHESRHQHALKRVRGNKGRFVNLAEGDDPPVPDTRIPCYPSMVNQAQSMASPPVRARPAVRAMLPATAAPPVRPSRVMTPSEPALPVPHPAMAQPYSAFPIQASPINDVEAPELSLSRVGSECQSATGVVSQNHCQTETTLEDILGSDPDVMHLF